MNVEIMGEKYKLVFDTGVPTFNIQTSTFVEAGLKADGYSFVDSVTGPQQVTNVKKLDFVVQGCTNDCIKSARYGLVMDHSMFAALGFDGAVNPSQLAWNGCITFNLSMNLALFSKHNADAACGLIPAETPTHVLTHKYRGEIAVGEGSKGVALFDTGSPVSLFAKALFRESIEFRELEGTYTSYLGSEKLFQVNDVTLTIGDRIFELETAFVVSGQTLPDADAIIGLDLLRNATFRVGINNPPEVYIPSGSGVSTAP